MRGKRPSPKAGGRRAGALCLLRANTFNFTFNQRDTLLNAGGQLLGNTALHY